MSHKIAILSFPGNNGDIENLRTLKRNGFDAFVFRWNDSLEKLSDTDGYFIGAGFSYEDRGRAGMVAARDPLFQFLHEESAKGKVIVGHCNGCQMLVESELVPLGGSLKMCMARNAIQNEPVGFLNEWIYITPTCAKSRCATSNWEGAMHIPIAHGEGRFVTKDPDLIAELQQSDQVAFTYCDATGNTSTESPITPNGSTLGIAGICNKEGNVVAMMPHAERTTNGNAYFQSIHQWIDSHSPTEEILEKKNAPVSSTVEDYSTDAVEIFIDTKITNNEERTVEQAMHHFVPTVELKQYRYIALKAMEPKEVLTQIAHFNPNKEFAFIRRGNTVNHWNSDTKQEEPANAHPLQDVTALLRRDEPDTGAIGLGQETETGICYACKNVPAEDLYKQNVLEVLSNPHASTLTRLV